jgi:hypothetical protein
MWLDWMVRPTIAARPSGRCSLHLEAASIPLGGLICCRVTCSIVMTERLCRPGAALRPALTSGSPRDDRMKKVAKARRGTRRLEGTQPRDGGSGRRDDVAMRWGIIMLVHGFIPGGPPRRKLLRDQSGTFLRFLTFQQACATVRSLGKLPHHMFEVIQLNAYGRPLPRWGVWRIGPTSSWLLDKDGSPVDFYTRAEALRKARWLECRQKLRSYSAKQLPPDE